ncbi:MAG: oligosaccharide flippase family protein [Pedobacter sp.]
MQKNSLTSNAIWNIFGRVIPLAITFFITPLLITHLGSANYGLYMLIMAVSGLMGLMSFGLGDATLRYVAYYSNIRDIAGINRVIRATLFVYLLVGILTVTVIFLFAPWVISLFSIEPSEHGVATILLRLTSMSFFFSLINGAFSAIPQALQRYDISTKVVITTTIIQAFFTLLLLFYGLGIVSLVILGVSVNCISVLMNRFFAKRLLPSIRLMPSMSYQGIREVFGYGLFSFLSQLFGVIFSYSDRLLMGVFIGASSVGYLTVPQDLAMRALSLAGQAGTVLFPHFCTLESIEEKSQIFLQATWAMLVLSSIIFVPLTIFMKDFLSLWINVKFAASCSDIGFLVAISSIIRGPFIVYESFIKGINKPQYITVLSFCVGITSLGLNLILIPRYGLSGAGYSYCITVFWGIVTLTLVWKYLFKHSDFRPLIRVFFIPAILSYFCVAIGFKFKSMYPPLGWFSLIFEVVVIILMTTTVHIIFDHIIGKEKGCTFVFLENIRGKRHLKVGI